MLMRVLRRICLKTTSVSSLAGIWTRVLPCALQAGALLSSPPWDSWLVRWCFRLKLGMNSFLMDIRSWTGQVGSSRVFASSAYTVLQYHRQFEPYPRSYASLVICPLSHSRSRSPCLVEPDSLRMVLRLRRKDK